MPHNAVSQRQRRGRLRATQKVSGLEWQAAIDALSPHMRDGYIATGFIAANKRCGAILATYAPPER